MKLAILPEVKPKLNHKPRPLLPRSLDEAAGLLKKKYPDLLKHYRKIRREWPRYTIS